MENPKNPKSKGGIDLYNLGISTCMHVSKGIHLSIPRPVVHLSAASSSKISWESVAAVLGRLFLTQFISEESLLGVTSQFSPQHFPVYPKATPHGV